MAGAPIQILLWNKRSIQKQIIMKSNNGNAQTQPNPAVAAPHKPQIDASNLLASLESIPGNTEDTVSRHPDEREEQKVAIKQNFATQGETQKGDAKAALKQTQFEMSPDAKGSQRLKGDSVFKRGQKSPHVQLKNFSTMKLAANAESLENSLYLESISQQSVQGLHFASHAKDGIRAEQSPPQTQLKEALASGHRSSRYKPMGERRRQKLESGPLASNEVPFTPSRNTNSQHGGMSSDQDRLGSKHYQDYLLQNEISEKHLSTPKIGTGRVRNTSINFNTTSQKVHRFESTARSLKHDFTIEEIKENHLDKVARVMEPFMASKNTMSHLMDGDTQNKNRVLRHTYQSYKKQLRTVSPGELKKRAGGLAVRTVQDFDRMHPTDPMKQSLAEQEFNERLSVNQVGRIIKPLSQVKVPKDIILMKIAQKELGLHEAEFHSQRAAKNDPNMSLMSETAKNQQSAQLRQLSSFPPIDSKDALGSTTNQSIDQVGQLNQTSIMESQNNLEEPSVQSIVAKNTKAKMFESKYLKQYQSLPGQLNIASTDMTNISASPSGFHITDLLKSTTSRGTERMQAAIDYYKRSVKTDEELNMMKEVIIKNYRLRVVDASKDLTAQDRKLMVNNKGTSIFVANSLIKPEIFKYSTKVSNQVPDVFVNYHKSQEAILTPLPDTVQNSKAHAFTFQDEVELGTVRHEQESRRELLSSQVQPIGQSQQRLFSQDQFSDTVIEQPENEETQGRETQAIQTPSSASSPMPMTVPQSLHNSVLQSKVQTKGKSRGVSTGLQLEQDEMHAVMISRVKAEQWLYPIDTLHDDKRKQLGEIRKQQDAGRYKLSNGMLAPLTQKEIAQRMSQQQTQQAMVQPRLLPVEELTAVSQFQDRPYLHLMRTIVHKPIRGLMQGFYNKTVKFNDTSPQLKSHENPLVQVMNYQHCLDGMAIVHQEFTHLDNHLVQDANLASDLFVEQEYIDQVLDQMIDRQPGEQVLAKTDFMFVDGSNITPTVIEVDIVDYDPETRQFTCLNNALNIQTTRLRQQLLLNTDPPNFINTMRKNIVKNKVETQQYMRVARLVQAELCRRFDNHQLSDAMRHAILYKTGDLTKYEKPLVERAIIQVEALYVFALMKACLSSQRFDPFVKNMLINFNIALDSPALEVQKQPYKEKKDLHSGIYHFKAQAIKNELDSVSLSISNPKYMKLPRFMFTVTWDAVQSNDQCMFQAPIPPVILMTFGGAKFKQLNVRQIEKQINMYPLEHMDWIDAEKVISEQFNNMIGRDWAEVIAKKVWSYIKDDFTFDSTRSFKESQVDKTLLKIFYQIKQFQVTVLYEMFEKGCRYFTRFLLSFALRDAEIKKSKIVRTIRKSNTFRLINDDPNYVQPKGFDVNDVDLIAINYNPFVKIHAEISITGKMRARKFRVVTVPDLDQIHKDFMGVVKNMHDATRQLKRCDALIFPFMELSNYFIPQPDVKTNPKVTYMLKLIDKLLDQCNAGCRRNVQNFQKYCSIFDKKIDGIVLELKKQSFALQNEGSEDEAEVPQSTAKDVIAVDEVEKHAKSSQGSQMNIAGTPRIGQDSESDPEVAEASEEEGLGFQGNNMAYKSVEIDDGLLSQEFSVIRKHRYSVMDEIEDQYDFGMLYLDCTPFKKTVIEHCEGLELELSMYLEKEFAEKMRQVNFEISALKGRLDDNVSSIDDVIALLTYIDTLKNQDNKVEEIADYISVMADQIAFVDSLQVMFPMPMRIEFLHMRNWPRTFDQWIKTRKHQLLDQKEELINSMKREAANVFVELEGHKNVLKNILGKGLKKITGEQSTVRQLMLKDLFDSMLPDNLDEKTPVKIPVDTTFQWLAQETAWHQNRFDCKIIEETFVELDDLRLAMEELHNSTLQINKRQALLGMEQTEFVENRVILDDIKPLHNLWAVTNQFRDLVRSWFEDPLQGVDYGVLELQIEEWNIELKRLIKAQIINENVKQMNLLQFVIECLVYIKKYYNLIKVTRVKGLKQRHWRQINTELKINIDPAFTCLLKMIAMRLYLDEPMRVIKAISDIAQKEYAIQMQTELLDIEIREIQFQFMNGPKSDCRLVKQIELVQGQFNEIMLRIQVLKTSPYAKNFLDKLLELEKTGKLVLELLEEFEMFQKKWLYLQNIFSQDTLQDSLAEEMKTWKGVDKYFKITIKSLIDQPHVWKLVNREGFLTSLKKQNEDCDFCKQGLVKFLEAKRQQFPRLYFLSNEELLNIYGQSEQIMQNLMSGQPKSFITTVFAGIEKVIMNQRSKAITAIEGQDGEQIPLQFAVTTDGPVEVWLQALQKSVGQGLKKQIVMAYQDMDQDLPNVPEDPAEMMRFKNSKAFQIRKVKSDTVHKWVERWPGQCAYVCYQLWFTQKMIFFFRGAKEKSLKVQEQRQKRINRGRKYARELESDSDEYKSIEPLSDEEPENMSHHEEAKDAQQKGDSNTSQQNLMDMRCGSQMSYVNAQHSYQESNYNQAANVASASSILSVKQGVAPKSRLPTVERAMRFWDRFQVNDIQHPCEVFTDIQQGNQQKIKALLDYLHSKCKTENRNSAVALVTQLVYQRDQMAHMETGRHFRIDDFEWEIQFKFQFEQLFKIFRSVNAGHLDQKTTKEMELALEMNEGAIKISLFNFTHYYGFEYLGNAQRLVITPLTLKAQRSMLIALQNQYGSSAEGPFGTGKTETVKDLAKTYARPLHTLNTSTEADYSEMLKFFKGIVASGSWVLFDEFNRQQLQIMNYITQLIQLVFNSMRGQAHYIVVDDSRIHLDKDLAFFITMNPGYAGRVDLPSNLRSLFRPVSMVTPDFTLITEILLCRGGFFQANELSKKINDVQKLANELVRHHSEVRMDFGLRAIKAIVEIAIGYLRQSENLQYSEVPDIINESAMGQINWNGSTVIKDIIYELNVEGQEPHQSQATIQNLIPQVQQKSNPQIKVMNQSSFAKLPELEQNFRSEIQTSSQEVPVENRKQFPPVAPSLQNPQHILINSSSENSVQLQATALNDILNSNIDRLKRQDDYYDENASDQEESEYIKDRFEGNPFFQSVFKGFKTRGDRQIKALYDQIGIRVEEEPTVEKIEEAIIVKAVQDFNVCKFKDSDRTVILSLIKNVFPSVDIEPKSQERETDFGNLTELFQLHMISHKLQKNAALEQKCYQLYEVTQVKMGCLIVGDSQASKTTLVQTVAGGLNIAMHNELKLRIAQERKNRLRQDVINSPQVNQLLPPHVVQNLQERYKVKSSHQELGSQSRQGSGDIRGSSQQITDGRKTEQSYQSLSQKPSDKDFNSSSYGKKKAKLSEKQKMFVWQELYEKTKLDRFEIFALEQELVMKGVHLQRLNPKSMSKSELIGELHPDSGAWIEGNLTKTLRNHSLDSSSLKKWIHLDGPIDHDWAENLNSILDDNQMMNLPNGDTIQVQNSTCLMFETESLKNLTPATVSRCGIIHMNRDELTKTKQIFNQYLSRLPPNLEENKLEIEAQVNWLIPTCFQVVQEEKAAGNLLIPNITEHWLVSTFIKVLDSYFFSYWFDFISGNKADWEDSPQQGALRHCTQALGYPKQPIDLVLQMQENVPKLDPIALEKEFKRMRIPKADKGEDLHNLFRLAYNDFVSSDARLENSLKYVAPWCEAFVISGLLNTFGPVLRQPAKKKLSLLLKEKIEAKKSDFQTYQKNKKKLHQAKEEAKRSNMKQAAREAQSSVLTAQQRSSVNKSVASLQSQSTIKPVTENLKATFDQRFTENFTDTNQAQLMFMTDFPFSDDLTMFDYFYNLDTNQWTPFQNTGNLQRMMKQYNNYHYSLQSVANLTVPTPEHVRLLYQIECQLYVKQPVLIAGSQATGKSTLVKQMLYETCNRFSTSVIADHYTCNYRTTGCLIKEHIQRHLFTQNIKEPEVRRDFEDLASDDDAGVLLSEDDTARPMPSYKTKQKTQPQTAQKSADSRPITGQSFQMLELMQKRMEEEQELRKMYPNGGHNNLLVYIEDLHLSKFDQFADNSAAEMLRELVDYRQWYSNKKRAVRSVDNVNLISCINTDNTCPHKVSERLLRHFSVVGIEPLTDTTSFAVIQPLAEISGASWDTSVKELIPNLSRAVFDLYRKCSENLRASPIKVQYQFNQREIFKMISALSKLEGNYMKTKTQLVKLFTHEALRQFSDRILMKKDLNKLTRIVKSVCCEHFYDQDVSQVDLDADDTPEALKPYPLNEPHNLLYSTLNDEVEGYYLEVISQGAVKEMIETHITRYNEQQDKHRLNMMLYLEFIKHLLKIMRAIGIYGGHLVVVGLRGYATIELIKLASFIQTKKFVPLEINPDFTDLDWQGEVRNWVIEAGQDDKQLSILLEEYRIMNPLWYRDIEALVSCNNFTNVLEQEDIFSMISAIKIQHDRRVRERQSGLKGNMEVDGVNDMPDQPEVKDAQNDNQKVSISNILDHSNKVVRENANMSNNLNHHLLMRIKKNMHFIMTFSPTGENFRTQMQVNHGLIANSQLIFVQNLTFDCLWQMGEYTFLPTQSEKAQDKIAEDIHRDQRLDKFNLSKEQEIHKKVLKAMVIIYLQTLQFSNYYYEKHRHRLFFTPAFFLSSLDNYERLLADRQKNVLSIRDRYAKGLEQIKTTILNINEYYQQLDINIPTLIERQTKIVAIIVDIQAKFEQFSADRDLCKEQEHQQTQRVTETEKLFRDCQFALDRIVPSLNESINSMRQISKYEIAEIHSMMEPPKMVKLVMKAVCIFLGIKPLMKIDKATGEQRPSYWRAAISTQCLGDPNLPTIMENFDRNRLSDEIVEQVEEIIADPEYTFENAKRSCGAIESVFIWVKALRDYYYIFKELEPRRDALIFSEKQYNNAVQALADKQEQIENIESELAQLRQIQQEKTQLVEDLKNEIAELTARKRRADQLMRGLNSEKQKWIVCLRMLDQSTKNVHGDVMLAAAIITYGGSFIFGFRRQLIEKWRLKAFVPNDISVDPGFQIQELFGDHFQIRDWHANDLPKDLMSTDNAMIMLKSKLYPVFIDPQQQASQWLKKQFADEGLQVTKLTNPAIKRIIEVSIEMGTQVMIEDMPERPDVHVESLVKQEVTVYRDKKMIKFCRKQLKLNPSFTFYMLTNIGKPRFDVNFTNYVTLINFYTTIEGLCQNLLGLVVANERAELEENYRESMEVVFTNVKALKRSENLTLEKLDAQSIEAVLGDETLIEELKESRSTAEKISLHLRKLQIYSGQLERSRVDFSPVAYRASTLYFGIQELQQLNPVYQYSLKWFLKQFASMLHMVNLLRKKTKVNIHSQEFAIDGGQMTLEARITLLCTTLTQEIMKKVTFSVFQEDRQIVPYYLAMSIIQAEKLTDSHLLAFGVTGSKYVCQEESEVEQPASKLPWLTKVMWSDIAYLQTLAPFNKVNLTEHILANQSKWDADFYLNKTIEFDLLPNKDLLKIDNFKTNEELMIAMMKRKEKEGTTVETIQSTDSSALRNTLYNAKKDASTAKPGQDPKAQVMSAEAALLDEDIWAVSEDEDDQPENNLVKLNKEFYEEPSSLLAEEQQMAKYMCESAPGVVRDKVDFKNMHKENLKQKKQDILKEQILKRTVELAIARCMRPDQIQHSLHALVASIYDFNYSSFATEVLCKFIDHDGTLDLRNRQIQTQTDEVHMPEKKKIENNIALLVDEALLDSACDMPVLFLTTHHTVTISQEMHGLHQRQNMTNKLHIQHCQKSDERRFKALLKYTMQNGDWLLIENIQLEPKWVEHVEQCLQQMQERQECSDKFRLWLSMPQRETTSDILIKACVKVALQQPSNIKQKMERHLSTVSGELMRKNIEFGNLQKNLMFGLIYLHSVLEGRRQYGTLGWNQGYQFDQTDYDISDKVYCSYMKEGVDKLRAIQSIKYIFGNITFSGKIDRMEDQRKLDAHITDLINDDISLLSEVGMDPERSHFGFPDREQDFTSFAKLSLPAVDNPKIFGFNQAISRLNQTKVATQITEWMKKLNHEQFYQMGYANSDINLKNQLNKFSLAKFGAILHKDEALTQSVTSNFIRLQQAMLQSSLDQSISHESDRYDERVDTQCLADREKYDLEVIEILAKIHSQLSKLFEVNVRTVNPQNEPLRYALLNELREFTALRDVMLNSIEEFQMYIRGFGPLPTKMEQLWLKIQNNQIPQTWLDASYETAHTSLAYYLADFMDKADFWQHVLKRIFETQKVLPAFQISAFYNPRLFLTANLQQYACGNALHIGNLSNKFTVTPFQNVTEIPEAEAARITQSQSILIHGMWLEGAQWDAQQKCLCDEKTFQTQAAFPVVEVQVAEQQEQDDENAFQDGPQLSPEELKEKKRTAELLRKQREEQLQLKRNPTKKVNVSAQASAMAATINRALQRSTTSITPKTKNLVSEQDEHDESNSNYYYYKCPVFATSERLSRGGVAADNKPLFYIKLRSLHKPYRWVKRGVALLMEPAVICKL